MANIVGVQFQKNGKIYYYDDNNLDIKQNDYVVAEAPHGPDLGQVVAGCCRQTAGTECENNSKKIIRIATEKDLTASAENREKEKEAFAICQKKIAEHELDMKLVSVEYAFDNSKALFYFTANGRVDFRSLVKDLASVFNMRIELRQIGVRDEARMIGGLGPCGLQICCGSFLDEFQPVSIKMAKEQNLSLNPTKISGVCGRLMCCLKYEQDYYEKTRKIMPRIGKEVITPDGNGTVCDLNIVKETVFVRITNGDSNEIKEYPLDKIEKTAALSSQPLPEKKSADESAAGQSSVSDAENDQRIPGNRSHLPENEPSKEEKVHNRGTGNENTGKNKDHRKPVKSETPKKNPALGKPVFRENPNRKTAAEKPASSDGSAEKKAGVSSSWAEAVQKAMDSIN